MKHKKFKGTFYPFDGSKALFLIWMEEEKAIQYLVSIKI
jgi:hypothetical protein